MSKATSRQDGCVWGYGGPAIVALSNYEFFVANPPLSLSLFFSFPDRATEMSDADSAQVTRLFRLIIDLASITMTRIVMNKFLPLVRFII